MYKDVLIWRFIAILFLIAYQESIVLFPQYYSFVSQLILRTAAFYYEFKKSFRRLFQQSPSIWLVAQIRKW